MKKKFRAVVFVGVSSMLPACENPNASYFKPVEVQGYIGELEERANVVFDVQDRSQMACILFSITNGDVRKLEKAMKPIVEVLEANIGADNENINVEDVINRVKLAVSSPSFQESVEKLKVFGENVERRVSSLCF